MEKNINECSIIELKAILFDIQGEIDSLSKQGLAIREILIKKIEGQKAQSN